MDNMEKESAYITYKRVLKGENMLFSELKCKDVINLRDCKLLGRVCDLEFDERNGCIHKLFVPRGKKWESFFKCKDDYVICYRDIKQIGLTLYWLTSVLTDKKPIFTLFSAKIS